MFDVEAFPRWGAVLPDDDEDAGDLEGDDEEVDVEDVEGDDDNDDNENNDDNNPAQEPDTLNWTDINESLRATLRRIAYAAESKPPLPDGSTFTLAVELRDDAPAPIGVRSQPLPPWNHPSIHPPIHPPTHPSTHPPVHSFTLTPNKLTTSCVASPTLDPFRTQTPAAHSLGT